MEFMNDTPADDLLERHLRKITRDEINELPLRSYDGPIHLIDNEDKIRFALDALSAEHILGFDTETKPSFEKGKPHPPSLLQLAVEDAVFIFQFSVLPFPDGLQHILSAPDIVKAGVAVRDDVKALQELTPFEAAGFVDLGEESRRLGFHTNGLRNLAANLMGFRVSKSAQRSNWGKRELSPQQLVYAATDAWVSREIYLRFRGMGLI